MDNITIPASITLEKSIRNKKYKWKSKNKESIYPQKQRRAALRFSSKNFAEKMRELDIEKRQISLEFIEKDKLKIRREKSPNRTLQAYSGNHPYIQIIINKILPTQMWKNFEKTKKKTMTFQINLEIDLDEWKDIKLSPWDFLIEVEQDAKNLMKKALEKKFKVNKVPKGRAYDLLLISPKNKILMLAISSHTAKTQSRSKEKTIQKILQDISKMLPFIKKEKAIPIILTKPINFERSWSFTTQNYLDFYKKKFGFIFLTTEFKKDWEDNIIEELLKI